MAFRSQDLKFLIDEHGSAVTLTTKSLGTYDPSTGGVTGGSTTTHTVLCYFYNYNLQDYDGVNIVMGDRRAVLDLVDTSGTAIPEPEVGDEITGSGDKVSIVGVAKMISAGVTVCYILQVRE
mgnify:CR=1 FL=1